MTKSTKILASILLVLVIGLGVIIGVPTIRNATADAIASWTSPKYAQSIEDNKKQAEEITSLKEEVKTKQNTIAEKDSLIATKDSQLKEKNTAIANYKTQLDTCKNNIETLSTQKVLLCNSLTEIDNKINSTTDSVELENLETKKSAILNKIDKLNNEIISLRDEETQLEEDIATLQQEKVTLKNEIAQLKTEKAKLQAEVADLQERLRLSEETAGVEYNYSYYCFGNMVYILGEEKGKWQYSSDSINNNFRGSAPSKQVYTDTNDCVTFSYGDQKFVNTFGYYDFASFDVIYTIEGQDASDDEIMNFIQVYRDIICNRGNFNCRIRVEETDENKILYIDLIGTAGDLYGIYFNKDSFIDFENSVAFSSGLYSGECFVTLGHASSYYPSMNFCIFYSDGGLSYELSERTENSFKLNGSSYFESVLLNLTGKYDDGTGSFVDFDNKSISLLSEDYTASNCQNLDMYQGLADSDFYSLLVKDADGNYNTFHIDSLTENSITISGITYTKATA